MNECETASCDVMVVPDNTSTTEQLQSKSHFSEENVKCCQILLGKEEDQRR